MTLDGASAGSWNQNGNPSFQITGAAAGPHVVGLNRTGAAGEYFYLGAMTYPVNGSGSAPATACYVGREVAGDTCEILADLETFLTTFGLGRTTTSGEQSPFLSWGEGIVQRLPLADGATDQTPTRGHCAPAGLTWSSGIACTTVGRREHCHGPYYHATVKLQPQPVRGDTIKAASTAGTRGRRIDSASSIVDKGRVVLQRASAILFMAVDVFLVRITAAGTGSAFAVGDLALCICTLQAGSANPSPYMVYTNSNTRAMGLYKLEAAS